MWIVLVGVVITGSVAAVLSIVKGAGFEECILSGSLGAIMGGLLGLYFYLKDRKR